MPPVTARQVGPHRAGTSVTADVVFVGNPVGGLTQIGHGDTAIKKRK